MSLKRLLYSLFLYLIFPIVFIRLLWKSRSNKAYRLRWAERLGFVPQSLKHTANQATLWLHAVSVGEVIAAKPLILSLLKDYPEHRLLVTSTTPTGSDRVTQLFADQIAKDKLIHFYLPYDLLGAVSRFLKALKPQMLLVVETEIWPNLFAQCQQRNIPMVMVNARLSDGSMRSYKKVAGLVAETLAKVNTIAVRSDSDAERFTLLGANPAQIENTGNIKYDLKIDEKQIARAAAYSSLIHQDKQTKRRVFVAASTHEGEDGKLLQGYSELLKRDPHLLLVLVPRHPERFSDVYDECLNLLPETIKVLKHSEYEQAEASLKTSANVIVGDSMGEMQLWYSLADVVFIGGSLVKTGGHNPLEATIFGVPVFSGPHMFNFEDVATELVANELLTICDNEKDLHVQILQYLEKIASDTDDQSRTQFKEKTDHFMRQHRGVIARLMQIIEKNLIA